MILAGIDIGTNSLRLLIAETDHGRFRTVHTERRTTRLGRRVDGTGTLTRESMESAVVCIKDYTLAANRYGASHIAAVGTSALRNASNAADFLSAVKRETGLAVRILSGEDEARLTLRGVAAAMKTRQETGISNNAIVLDIGGGSTEIIFTRDGSEIELFSLPLGAVYLTERYFLSDPPGQDELSIVKEIIRRELTAYRKALMQYGPGVLIGTAGTITTLAAMTLQLDAYDAHRINGAVMERKSVDVLVESMSMLTVEERSRMRGLGAGRADIILAGSLVLQEIMTQGGFDRIFVSDWGLREGIVLDLADRNT